MTPTLADFQQTFAQALLGTGPVPAEWAAQPGFAVYRNTVLGGCVDALEANHPVAAALTGRAWLRAAAASRPGSRSGRRWVISLLIGFSIRTASAPPPKNAAEGWSIKL